MLVSILSLTLRGHYSPGHSGLRFLPLQELTLGRLLNLSTGLLLVFLLPTLNLSLGCSSCIATSLEETESKSILTPSDQKITITWCGMYREPSLAFTAVPTLICTAQHTDMAFSVSRGWAAVIPIAMCFGFVAWTSNSCAAFLQRHSSPEKYV
jgi:hypothetical protein